MAAITTFDQWRKDVFFSAAEEVQESADTMESVYRMWQRERSDGFEPEFCNKLQRELQTTLGTAKWQLEEFERAVGLSHENYPPEDNAVTRHTEFVTAIRNKISHVEEAINNSLLKEGKQRLRWVQLEEDERDDLEKFLSATPQNFQREKKDKSGKRKSGRGDKETVTFNKDAKYRVEVAAKEPSSGQDKVEVREENLSAQSSAGSSQDIAAWKIVIADEEDVGEKFVEAMPETCNSTTLSRYGCFRNMKTVTKLNWLRNSFVKAKSGEHFQPRQGFLSRLDLRGYTLVVQGVSRLNERSRSFLNSSKEAPKGSSNQQIGRLGRFQRQIQGSQTNRHSLRVTLLLVLSIFLIVPFVF